MSSVIIPQYMYMTGQSEQTFFKTRAGAQASFGRAAGEQLGGDKKACNLSRWAAIYWQNDDR
jgi:hypothetical protein